MSDTVKLIIEIPESIFDTIQADEMISREQLVILQRHILNGTPLDDVKAEISKCKTQNEMQLSARDTKGKLMISDIYCHIIETLDNIGKESEVKTNE